MAVGYRAPVTRFGWAQELATSAAKDMPTANKDTFYMSAVVVLDPPYILSAPDTGDFRRAAGRAAARRARAVVEVVWRHKS